MIIKQVQFLYKIFTLTSNNFYTIKIYIILIIYITFFKICDLFMLHSENQPRYKIHNIALEVK